jgi:uncharacterized membrane protein YfcA
MEYVLVAAVGLIAGTMSGMFGVGGGVVIVPALILILGFDTHKAVGTSLAALVLPVALFGVLNYARTGNVSFKAAAILAGALAIAAPLGSHIALSLSNEMLTKIFGAFLMAVSVKFLFFPT